VGDSNNIPSILTYTLIFDFRLFLQKKSSLKKVHQSQISLSLSLFNICNGHTHHQATANKKTFLSLAFIHHHTKISLHEIYILLKIKFLFCWENSNIPCANISSYIPLLLPPLQTSTCVHVKHFSPLFSLSRSISLVGK
jgi:hypothetical protein